MKKNSSALQLKNLMKNELRGHNNELSFSPSQQLINKQEKSTAALTSSQSSPSTSSRSPSSLARSRQRSRSNHSKSILKGSRSKTIIISDFIINEEEEHEMTQSIDVSKQAKRGQIKQTQTPEFSNKVEQESIYQTENQSPTQSVSQCLSKTHISYEYHSDSLIVHLNNICPKDPQLIQLLKSQIQKTISHYQQKKQIKSRIRGVLTETNLYSNNSYKQY